MIIGHNADIAWGFTNLGPDVTDLYLERVTATQWEQDGRPRPLTIANETIRVRGEDDVPLQRARDRARSDHQRRLRLLPRPGRQRQLHGRVPRLDRADAVPHR